MMRALRSLASGLSLVVRAPLLVIAVAAATVMTAAPFGVMLGVRLQDSLASQPPIARGSGEIDPEWWLEFREHARGLEATFTPTVIGFAAPLDNLSSLLDATPRPWALAGPAIVALLLWAFLWGGAIERVARGRGPGIRRFWSAGARYFPRFAAISLIAGAINVILFLTVHRVLFGPVYRWLETSAASERSAFFWRVGLYVIFGSLLIGVSLIADYARITTVVSGAASLRAAVTSAVAFLRRNASAALALYLLTGVLFVTVLVAYGTLETVGGSRVGGWRGIFIGQAYIIARLVIRLTFAASEVRLYQAAAPDAAQSAS